MSKTSISDIIVPSEFEKYAIERTATKSALIAAGIIARDSAFDALAAGGGKIVSMPFWQDLTAGRQVLSDSGGLTVNKIAASQDLAIINNDGNAWSANDLAGALAGSDPLNALLELVGTHWARVDQDYVLAVLAGIFAAPSMAGNKLAIASETIAGQSAATRLNGSTFVDASVKLGDRSDRLTAVAMHSATEAALRKLDLIDAIPDSEGKGQISIFQGRRVIVDDGLPVRDGTTDGKVYTSYLFGQGAFGLGVAPLNEPVVGGNGTKGVEWARVALDGDTTLINRRRFLLHPRGVKFTSDTLAGVSPDDEELATGDNWERVFEAKNVRIVAVEHN